MHLDEFKLNIKGTAHLLHLKADETRWNFTSQLTETKTDTHKLNSSVSLQKS